MSDFQADLASLEGAARDRDPERAQFLLKRLFMGMNVYRALAVAVERVYAFVPVFERSYPDAVCYADHHAGNGAAAASGCAAGLHGTRCG